MRGWPARIGVAAVLAVPLHLAMVWAVPRAITLTALHRIAAISGYNRAVFPPPPDEHARAVVMPSPDLLYAACAFDVSARPVLIAARPSKGYWSLAFYAANSDNFFSLNDREAHGAPVEVVLVGPRGAEIPERYRAARVVRAPTSTGLMLTRSLVTDPAGQAEATDARAATRCEDIQP